MNDEEIATKLAEAMGWTNQRIDDRSFNEYWDLPSGRIYVFPNRKHFAPAVDWDHIGIALNWAKENKDLHLDASYITQSPDGPFYALRFLRPGETFYAAGNPYPDLSPRSIALCLLKAVEG
jgi:hypothetical protein